MGTSREIELLREVMEEEYEPEPQPGPTVKHYPTVEAESLPPGKSRRTLRDIRRTWNPEEIYRLITERTWPYRSWIPFYQCRDKAFMSLLYETAGRIGEVISLRKGQFDQRADPEFIIIRDMLTEKIRPGGKNFPYREETPLPRKGRLQPFTELVLSYLDLMGEYNTREERLFPFSRQRGFQIVKHITGKWPHWFRAQGERYYGRVLGDVFALRDFVNVANITTLAQYVRKNWRESREKLLRE